MVYSLNSIKKIKIGIEKLINYFYLRENKYSNFISICYLSDIKTIQDAVDTLKYLTNNGYNSTDKLIERIIYLYSRDLPNYQYLARLSLLHQSVIDTKGIEEYSVLTLWNCAIEAIIEDEERKSRYIKIKLIVDNNAKVNLESINFSI